MEKMNQYECMYIIDANQSEDAINALKEKFNGLIAKNGEIESVDEWGKRRLAYEIEHKTEGYYMLVNFKAPVDFPAELHRVMGIDEGIIRCMIIRK